MATNKLRRFLTPSLVFMLALAFTVGFFGQNLMKKVTPTMKEDEEVQIPLPDGLVKISGCIPYEGEHYVHPEDVPHGPFYVINEGKLLAIEYMFEPDEIPGEKYAKLSFPAFAGEMQKKNLDLKDVVSELQGLSFDLLNAKYTYSDLHWTAPHAGETNPHFDIHFYLASKEEMQKVCPESTLQDVLPEDLIQEIIKSGVPMPQP